MRLRNLVRQKIICGVEAITGKVTEEGVSPPIHGHLVRWTRIRLSVGLSGVCNVVPISDGAAK